MEHKGRDLANIAKLEVHSPRISHITYTAAGSNGRERELVQCAEVVLFPALDVEVSTYGIVVFGQLEP